MRNAYAQVQHLLCQRDGTTSMRLELGGVCLLRGESSPHAKRIRGAWFLLRATQPQDIVVCIE